MSDKTSTSCGDDPECRCFFCREVRAAEERRIVAAAPKGKRKIRAHPRFAEVAVEVVRAARRLLECARARDERVFGRA